MIIKVLGRGCPECEKLESRTREALEELGVTADIEQVSDPVVIADYGVTATPSLVVDGGVLIVGKVPTARRISEILVR